MEQLILKTKPSKQELRELLNVIYKFILEPIPEYNTKDNSARSTYYKAEEAFQQILFDRCAEQRKWIAEDWYRARNRGVSAQEYLADSYLELPALQFNKDKAVPEYFYENHNYPPVVQVPFTTEEAYQELQPYFQLVEKQLEENKYVHLNLSWDVVKFAQEPIRNAFYKWFKRLEEKGLVEDNFSNNIAQAIEWQQFAVDYEERRISEEDFQQWIEWLDHDSILLRATASRCIGSMYANWIEEEDYGFIANSVIPIQKMMELLYQKQTEGKFVAGGFINGITDCDGLKALEENHFVKNANINVKEWVLKILINSPEEEPYNPAAQSFWFYVHEYFDFDADSVHKLIDHHRYWIAMMCATESLNYGSTDCMKPVLERLAKEAPREIAEHCKAVLNRIDKVNE